MAVGESPSSTSGTTCWWNGLSTPVELAAEQAGTTKDMVRLPINQWQSNIYTRDVPSIRTATAFRTTASPASRWCRPTSVSATAALQLQQHRPERLRQLNEVFPLFTGNVVETDSTRYKNTGTTWSRRRRRACRRQPPRATDWLPACGTATRLHQHGAHQGRRSGSRQLAGSRRQVLRTADCLTGDTAGGSTGRVDPPITTPYGLHLWLAGLFR